MANPREIATPDGLLQVLREFNPPGAWARPMDLGGNDGSNHSRVLVKLVRAGLVERRTRGSIRSYEYRIKQNQETP